jgi:DNA-binding NtrC family response regulator
MRLSAEDETSRITRPSQRSLPRLEWSDSAGTHAVTVERRFVVGSAPHCDLIIADSTVSRVHAEIEPRDEGLWIRDLNSRNGTQVAGVSVEAACAFHGFTIRIGATELLVDYNNAEKRTVDRWPSDRFGPLLGKSQVMRELFSTLARLAPLEACIMIHGETGSGKELVARAIHETSTRASGPFVVVDCAALSDNLIEAELFGHAKGAFTGADQSRVGAIETAHGGTVFLDEIGELPLAMQPKLLRVLESSTVRRIGESKHREVNVRFVTATHRDLLSMVNRGEFREDLYFRLAVVPVRVPALRERVDDIGLLLTLFSEGSVGWLTPSLLRALEGRPWRGNVRELRNFAARAQALGPTGALALCAEWSDTRESVTQRPAPMPDGPDGFRSLSAQVTDGVSSSSPPGHDSLAPLASEATMPKFAQPFRTFREQWISYGERTFLQALLERHRRNVAAAAKEAELDRTYMYRLLRKHGL